MLSPRLIHALWTFNLVFDAILGMSQYKQVFENVCVSLVKVEYRDMLAMNNVNLDWITITPQDIETSLTWR